MTNLDKMIKAKTEEECFDILLEYRQALLKDGEDLITIEWLHEEAK